MIEFKPATADHVRSIDAQFEQLMDRNFNLHNLDALVANSLAVSGWLNGKCIGAAGYQPIWIGRAAGWALIGRDAGPAMVPIVRKIRFFLAACPVNRIEMTVREKFSEGCRLAALLGFNAEARLLGFFPDGSTAILYSRILRS